MYKKNILDWLKLKFGDIKGYLKVTKCKYLGGSSNGKLIADKKK